MLCKHKTCLIKREFNEKVGRYVGDDARKYPKMYPDILLHRRDCCDDDVLAIEIKIEGKNSGRQEDRGKLTYLTCVAAPYQYQYGFFLDFGLQVCKYTMYQKGKESVQRVLYEKR